MAASCMDAKTGELMQSFESGMKRSELQRYVEEAVTANAIFMHGLTRIHDLVSMFKEVAGCQSFEQEETFPLRDVITDVLNSCTAELQAVGCTVDVNVAPEVYVTSYRHSLSKVLLALVSNALSHGFEGRTDGKIGIACRRVGDKLEQLELIVSDNGMGIAAPLLPLIFDPFFTTKMGNKHAGLGLSVVHNVVTGTLGGSVKASSSGNGTTFVLTLAI
jgi:C4-dicarboxylate-specific signal transduction histidine kinase